jgi:hypothetical protein
MALSAETRPDQAEQEGCGALTAEDDNEEWPSFSPQLEGTCTLIFIGKVLVRVGIARSARGIIFLSACHEG